MSRPAVTALSSLSAPLATALALLMMAAVISLVAWALQLMQSANDSREFSLMLAGCMVCSAAVGLATVMVLTFTSPERVHARDLVDRPDQAAGISLDAIVLPWDPPLQRPSLAPR